MPSIDTKGKTTGDIAKEVSAKFKEISEEKRAELQKEADKFKVEYEKKVIEFRKAQQYSSYLKERYKVKLRENKLVNLRDAPKKPKSVFALYAEKHKAELEQAVKELKEKEEQEAKETGEEPKPKGKGKGKGSIVLKGKFSQATEEEKQQLEELQKKGKEDYIREVQEWKESDRYKTYLKTEE